MKAKNIFILIFLVVCIKQSVAQNVMISSDYYPNEPSIKINPNNPALMVAGANLNNYYYSSDTGKTWQTGILTCDYGVWGDPVIDVDKYGNFYFFHLANYPQGSFVDRIICQKSSDNGVSWTSGTYTGLNGTKVQDKEWSVIDFNNNNIYITWTQFDNYQSLNPADSSVILFSKSEDEGATWSIPLRISKFAGDCADDDNTVEGAYPAVGANGELYVVWASGQGLMFNKSMDEGETWLEQEVKIADIPGGWAYDVPGIFRANGLPVLKCDLSAGEHQGTLYVNWTDQRNGTDDTDVWLIKSEDQGETWTEPIRVNNDDAGHQQFFTWMDIDQTNGKLYFVFYDRRNYSDTNTDVYLAVSEDAGATFENKLISESPFVPSKSVFFGDYTNISVHNGIVRPIWTRLHNGELSVWTDISDGATNVGLVERVKESADLKQYPNPVVNQSYFSFKLRKKSIVNLDISDMNGRVVYTVIHQREMDYGKYVETINTDQIGLSGGVYNLTLTCDGHVVKSRKMIVK